MKEPKISIITVVYNGSTTVAQTMESVLQQDYPDLEYIVIDGNSTDGTQEIIRRYEDRLAYWVSEPDGGIYEAMNKGLSHATGELVGIINSDDWYEPDTVRKVADLYRRTNGDVICGEIAYVSESGERIFCTENSLIPPHPGMFVKRSVYERYGKFKTEYRIAADHEFKLRLLANDVSLVRCGDVLANFRAGGISNTRILECKRETYRIESLYADRGLELLPERAAVKERHLRMLLSYFAEEESTVLYEKLRNAYAPWGDAVLIRGAGKWGRCLAKIFKGRDVPIFFEDGDSQKWGTKTEGLPIISPFDGSRIQGTVFVGIADGQQEIKRQMEKEHKAAVQIITLDEVLALLEEFL